MRVEVSVCKRMLRVILILQTDVRVQFYVMCVMYVILALVVI